MILLKIDNNYFLLLDGLALHCVLQVFSRTSKTLRSSGFSLLALTKCRKTCGGVADSQYQYLFVKHDQNQLWALY